MKKPSNKKDEKQELKEIDPTPFNGAIFSDNVVKNSIIISKKKKPKLEPKIDIDLKIKKVSVEPTSSNITKKQQQLEKDMREVLGFLSNKLDMHEEITIDKKNIRDYDPPLLRRIIGMVFQFPAIFPGSVKDNLKYGMNIWNIQNNGQMEKAINDACLGSSLLNKNAEKLTG